MQIVSNSFNLKLSYLSGEGGFAIDKNQKKEIC